MVFVRFPFEKKIQSLFHDLVVDSSRIQTHVASYLGTDDFSLYCNGKKLQPGQDVLCDTTVHVTFSLPGGKGGFGSMLRAIGAQIEKTTNREACRDLSGRRLRDINEEQRLKKWISKESEREQEKIRRRKERIERLKAQPKHNFVDFEYEKLISELPERIDDALTAGMQKASKRPVEGGESSTSAIGHKKKRLWLDEDISESSGSDSENCEKTEDTGFSSSSDQNKNILHILGPSSSEASEVESSNSCETKPMDEGMDPVAQEQRSSSAVVNTKEMSSSAETHADPLIPFQEKLSDNLQASGSSTQEVINQEEDSPVDLLTFESVEEVEALGLNRLKTALMARGLKCGGRISDRAERLWKVRGLLPSEYPANLLAKSKK